MPAEITGLYLGKFQPFHNGHLYAVKHILSQVNRLIIVIGSSQYSGSAGQPFSAEKRRQMIEQTLSAENLNVFEVFEVPDINDNKNWVEHLCGYIKHFDIVYTNNHLTKRLFSEQGYEVSAIDVLSGVSGTLIRQKIANCEHDWPSLVPAATAEIVKRYLAEKQVKRRIPPKDKQ